MNPWYLSKVLGTVLILLLLDGSTPPSGLRRLGWYAFENVGFRHLPQLKAALGVAAVATVASTFYKTASKISGGAQIDLVIQQADNAIHLYDFKHYNLPFRLTKQQMNRLEEQKTSFRLSQVHIPVPLPPNSGKYCPLRCGKHVLSSTLCSGPLTP